MYVYKNHQDLNLQIRKPLHPFEQLLNNLACFLILFLILYEADNYKIALQI